MKKGQASGCFLLIFPALLPLGSLEQKQDSLCFDARLCRPLTYEVVRPHPGARVYVGEPGSRCFALARRGWASAKLALGFRGKERTLSFPRGVTLLGPSNY